MPKHAESHMSTSLIHFLDAVLSHLLGIAYQLKIQPRLVIDHDDAQQHNIDHAAGTVAVSQYTPDQQFQIGFGKIQRDIQVEQNKALELAQKREVLMMLYGQKNT